MAMRQLAKALGLPLLRARFRRQTTAFTPPYRLHLGCGWHHLDGWINIDFEDTPARDVWWNLAQPIPLPSGSCQYIFHEHVLEHFELSRGLKLLRECHRLLAPGGVMRVAMPSLDDIFEKYAKGGWSGDHGVHMPEVKTRAEYVNVMFRHWGHQWIYDVEELTRRLGDVGFKDVVEAKFHESSHSALSGLEHRKDSLLICEATK